MIIQRIKLNKQSEGIDLKTNWGSEVASVFSYSDRTASNVQTNSIIIKFSSHAVSRDNNVLIIREGTKSAHLGWERPGQ